MAGYSLKNWRTTCSANNKSCRKQFLQAKFVKTDLYRRIPERIMQNKTYW